MNHLALIIALALVVPAPAAAQTEEREKASVSPTRLEPGTKVEIDGVLDEPFWTSAGKLGPLTQVEPIQGAPASNPTDVYLAYDEDFLYVGLVCHDDPSEVRARQMDRDAFIQYDDVVELWIDTFADERFAYWFQITPGGSRGDSLLSDSGSSFNKSWDGIWYGRSRVTKRGWEAELALPFKTLAFRRGAPHWGFNLRRKRVANGEELRWASPDNAYQFFRLSEGGRLLGMEGMQQGKGIEVVPYAKSGIFRERDTDRSYDQDGDFGLDFAWRPTPETNLRVTLNTDFAETEVDERQINLSRFPLFFPEKRDFFLEDAGVFEFGPSSRRGPSVIPFFSRRIGRDPDGNAVPIMAGAKFTGRVGDWNIGFLDTQVDAYSYDDGGVDTDVGEQNLGVLRVQRNLGGESAVGMILTHGSPDSDLESSTYGADFRLGSSRLFGPGHSGTLWGWWLASASEDDQGDGQAFGARAETRTSRWTHRLETQSVEESFDPELGFVRRTGFDRYSYSLSHTWRGQTGDWLRRIESRVSPRYDDDRLGIEDAWVVPIDWFEAELWSEDSVSFETTLLGETLEDGFDLSDDVSVSPGDYDMTRHEVSFETNDRRKVGAELSVEWGDFFSGDILRTRFEPIFLPTPGLRWSMSVTDVRTDLDEGDFDTTLVGSNLDVSFNPDLSWKNFIQYDTESEDLSWQSRLHWIVEPGQNLYVVGLFGWDRFDRDSFARESEELTVKLSYTWRF